MRGSRDRRGCAGWLALAGLLAAAACAVRPEAEPAPATMAPRLEEARLLAARGAYVPLKRAWRIYADLSLDPRARSAAAR